MGFPRLFLRKLQHVQQYEQMKKLSGFFFQGLLYLAPLAITIYIAVVVFNFTDGLLQSYLQKWFDIRIPGLGILITIVFLTIIGYLGQTIITRPIRRMTGKLMVRIPLLKVIYSAFNDLVSAFVGKERKFNVPVIVTVNEELNFQKLGFLTEDDLSSVDEPGQAAVYFPHSYNWSGELFLVPRDKIRVLDIPPMEVMKFIVSAGVAKWEDPS